MKKVIVYTSPSCPYCVRAKQLLSQRNISFEEVMIPWDDEAGWEAMIKRSGMKTVPQIFVEDKCIGGYTELSKLDSSGELVSLLNS
ncbi:MAG: glutaredoxin 3 [Oligoflexia bacterium]|nr:glutaredoxin 3 [Oligoflexia bacterium]